MGRLYTLGIRHRTGAFALKDSEEGEYLSRMMSFYRDLYNIRHELLRVIFSKNYTYEEQRIIYRLVRILTTEGYDGTEYKKWLEESREKRKESK